MYVVCKQIPNLFPPGPQNPYIIAVLLVLTMSDIGSNVKELVEEIAHGRPGGTGESAGSSSHHMIGRYCRRVSNLCAYIFRV